MISVHMLRISGGDNLNICIVTCAYYSRKPAAGGGAAFGLSQGIRSVKKLDNYSKQ